MFLNSIHMSFDLVTSCSVRADNVGVNVFLGRVSRHAYDPSSTLCFDNSSHQLISFHSNPLTCSKHTSHPPSKSDRIYHPMNGETRVSAFLLQWNCCSCGCTVGCNACAKKWVATCGRARKHDGSPAQPTDPHRADKPMLSSSRGYSVMTFAVPTFSLTTSSHRLSRPSVDCQGWVLAFLSKTSLQWRIEHHSARNPFERFRRGFANVVVSVTIHDDTPIFSILFLDICERTCFCRCFCGCFCICQYFCLCFCLCFCKYSVILKVV